MSPDSDLLFGVIAVRARFIAPDQFTAACAAKVNSPGIFLADILVERGWLSAEDRRRVERLVGEHLTSDRTTPQPVNPPDPSTRTGLPGLVSTLPVDNGGKPAATDGAAARGRYRLVRQLGAGGMGVVWRALDPLLGREVALKEVRAELAADDRARARFADEARTASRLEHPGIVPVYELAGPADGGSFYAMRLVEGQTLSEAVAEFHRRRSGGPPDPADLSALLRKFVAVCNAVAYAHSRGVIHRDLKGANIKFGPFDDVQVLDWGLAKTVGTPADPCGSLPADGPGSSWDVTREGDRKGTPAYMSPEQARGEVDGVDHRSDVYGLGAVLYEVLVGRPPFPRPDRPTPTGLPRTAAWEELFRQVEEDGPLPPRQADGGGWVPRPLEAVCLRAMARNKADRYPTAGELAAEVTRWLDDRPVAAYPDPFPTRARRWVGRHRTLVTGSVAAVTVAAVALAVGLVLLDRANAAERAAQGRALDKERQAAAEREARGREQGLREAAEDRLRTGQYVSAVRGGKIAFDAGNPAQGRDHLRTAREQSPDGRPGFEYFQQRYQVYGGRAIQLGGDRGRVRDLDFSPDGTLLAVAADGPTAKGPGRVEVWDVAQRAFVVGREVPGGPATAVRFAPDGRGFVVGGHDGSVRVWSTTDGNPVKTFAAGPGPITGIGFSRDGRRIATVGGRKLARIWDTAGWTEVWSFRFGDPGEGDDLPRRSEVCFSPSGAEVAIGDGRTAVWFADVTARSVVPASPNPDGNTSFAAAPDWSVAAVGGGSGEVLLVDPRTGRTRAALVGHAKQTTDCRFSADGRAVATAGLEPVVRVWDTKTGRPVAALRGLSASVGGLAVSPDGKRVAAGGSGPVLVWDLDGHPDVASVRLPRRVRAVAPVPGEPVTLAALGIPSDDILPTGEVVLVDHRTGRLTTLSAPAGEVQAVSAFSPDGAIVAAGGNGPSPSGILPSEVRVWDVRTGALKRTLGRLPFMVGYVRFSADGKHLLALSGSGLRPDDCVAVVWRTDDWNEVGRLTGEFGIPSGGEFTPDGGRVILGWLDVRNPAAPGRVTAWDFRRGSSTVVVPRTTRPVASLRLSRDGRWAVTSGIYPNWMSAPGAVQFWDLVTGKLARGIGSGPLPLPLCVAVAPDEKMVAATAADGVRVWDAESGAIRHTFAGFPELPQWADFSSDGRRLSVVAAPLYDPAGTRPGLIRVYDTETGKLIREAKIPRGTHVSAAPTGGLLAVAGPGGIQLLDSDTLAPVRRLEVGKPPTVFTGSVATVAASADGRWLASGGSDKRVVVWPRADLTKPVVLTGHADGVCDLAFSPDGRWLASVDGNVFPEILPETAEKSREVIVWDVAAGRERNRFTVGSAWGCKVAFLADGETIAVAASPDPRGAKPASHVRLYDGRTGQVAAEIAFRIPLFAVTALAVAPAGDRLAVGTYSGYLTTVELTSGREQPIGFGHPNAVVGLAFTPDGRTLASGESDGPCKLWHAATGQEFYAIPAQEGRLGGLAFTADGQALVTGGDRDLAGELRVWPAPTAQYVREELLPQREPGTVRTVNRSDESGRLLESESQDEAGQPARSTATGYARAVLRYGPGGEVIGRDYFDEAGRPVTTEVRVRAVLPESVAAKLGLKPGDVLVRYDSRPVGSAQDLIKTRTAEPPNGPAKELVVRRKSGEVTVAVPPGRMGAVLADVATDLPP